ANAANNSADLDEAINPDIQHVQALIQKCFSERKRCSSLTTHFYVAGDMDPEYYVTVTYPQAASKSRETLLSFQLSTDTLELSAIPCVFPRGALQAGSTYGPITISKVVLQADVIFDTGDRRRIRNSRLTFDDSISYPVEIENSDYNTVVQKLTTFIDEQC
uniref:RWD domain-containing protein n=1 Tax=Mesocestoides corti TaxID=53468 RepID=A0A5K3F2L5_MESCO